MPPAAAIGVGLAAAGIGGAISSRNQNKAMSAAERQQQAAIEEQRRLEEKFGLTPDDLERQSRVFELEKERQGELEQRAGLTGEELLRGEGPITDQLLNEIQSRLGQTGENLFLRDTGQVGANLRDSVANFDEDLFNKELSQVLNAVNQQANRRGVFNTQQPEGSIRFENLGRAGVDLAIKSAQERLSQQKALSEAFLNLSQGARGEGAQVGTAAITASDRARDELQKFLNDIQTLDAESKGRAMQGALGAAQIASPQIQQTFGAQQSIFGDKAGFGKGLTSAGLNLATLGALPSLFPQTSQTQAPTKQIEEFEPEKIPFRGLRSVTGRELLDEFASMRGGF